MSFGCFVDIRQQDGSLVRMHYPYTKDSLQLVKWVGIQEQTADKFREQKCVDSGV